jgi:hypothetical protein
MVQPEPNISNNNDKGADISASLHYHFDVVYLLTTNRTERAVNECKRIGILPVVCVSEIHSDKIISFNMSMISILRKFIQSGLGRCLIVEDDVIFQNEDTTFCSGWDMVYLGGNYLPAGDNTAPQYVDENTRRIYNAWTTHAVGYKAHVARWIVDNYDTGIMYDCWLDKQLHKFNTMAVVPMIAEQLPSYSTIWQRDVDYSDTFKAGNEFLQSIR